MNLLRRIEWMSLLAFVLVVVALGAYAADRLSSGDASLLIGAAVVCAILALRGR